MYANGIGVPQDGAEAVQWFHKADAMGEVEVQNKLGVLYANGAGIAQDDDEAVKWFRKAAEQGHAVAQCNFGSMYWTGKGVPEDFTIAYMWFNLAAAQGEENAKICKDVISEKMTKEQIAEAQKMSREWMEKRERK